MKKLWEKFTDNFGETILHPQYIALTLSYKSISELKKRAHGRLIDIGCGRMPYRDEIEPLCEEYVGVDHPKTSRLYHPEKQPDVFADAVDLPFKSRTFDIALMLQVLEYLENPLVAFREVSRVLKKDGILIISSPFLYPIHDAPYDKARYTEFMIKKMLKETKFKILKFESEGDFLEFWLLSINNFLFKRINDILKSKINFISVLYLIFLIFISLTLVPLNNLVIAIKRYIGINWAKKYPNYFPLIYLVVAKKI